MICKQCKIEMKLFKPNNEPYCICSKCNRVDIPTQPLEKD